MSKDRSSSNLPQRGEAAATAKVQQEQTNLKPHWLGNVNFLG